MSARRKPKATVPRVLGDFGAVLARVEVLDVADPAAPMATIRRARVKCGYDTLWRRGGLTDAEREAADRFAHTCDLAAGARDRPAAGMAGHREPWNQGHPAQTTLRATTSLRGVQVALGNDANALLLLYVRDNLPAGEIAARRKEREDCTLGRIKAALTRLSEHWGM
jgi:hypothetical protein